MDEARIAYVSVQMGSPVKCFSPSGLAIHVGDQCIIDDAGTLDFGTVARFEDMSEREDVTGLPQLVRRATLQDQTRERENALRSKMAVETCSKAVETNKLEMRMVNVRYSFDRRLLSVVFTADGRIDFRQMVKDLAAELKCRVRMKQIGVRDEAGVIGGMGPCGRVLCCCQWLRRFDSINVRMAKSQRISMNPNTISGMCSRLKCCLRYEEDQYREMDRLLPQDGERVMSPDGAGVVMDKDILRRRVRLELEDHRIMEYSADDLERI